MDRVRRRRLRRGLVAAAAAVAVVVTAGSLYERPAHSYDTHFEPCWSAVALHALGAASTFAPSFCSSPPGTVAGLGPVTLLNSSPGLQPRWVVFTTGEQPGRGEEGVEYVAGGRPVADNCASPLGGPWWQLAFLNLTSMSCPRGFTFQPGP